MNQAAPGSKLSTGLRAVGGLVIAALIIGGVVLLAWRRSRPPQHCAEGLVAFGARCCGVGQHLEGTRCVGRPTRCAAAMAVTERGCVPQTRRVAIAGGRLLVIPGDWEAERQVTPLRAEMAPFAIDSHEVTEAAYSQCAAAARCAELPTTEPGRPRVDVTAAEAAACCRFRGGTLPSREQWVWSATGSEGRRYPWGQTGAVCRRAAFGLASGPCAHGATGPALAGAHPEGATPEGVQDLAGNAAEWTAPAANDVSAVCGGSWADASAADLRVWSCRLVAAGERSNRVGFRCAYPAEGNNGRP